MSDIVKKCRGRPKLALTDEERVEHDRLQYEKHKIKQREKYVKVPDEMKKKRGRKPKNLLCQKCGNQIE